MGRIPAFRRRSAIQAGVGACGSTPRTARATNRSHPGRPWIGASSLTSPPNPPGAGAGGCSRVTGSVNAAPVEWEYSRAPPRIEKQYRDPG